MKDKLTKVILALLIIALALFSILLFFILFNILSAYKTTSGNDLISFVGGIIGSIIAGMIAIVTFYYTIKNNNKNLKESNDLQNKLNIENNNLQIALKIEDQLNKKIEKERSVIAITYNKLEDFLFAVSNMLNQNNDYIEMKNDFLRLYKEVLSSINTIKFNSEIFDDRNLCENCEMCNIKMYGALVKSAADIKRKISVIDEECRVVLGHLEAALNTAAKSKQLLDEKLSLQKININNEDLISRKKSQIINPIDSLTPQEQVCHDEILSIHQNIEINKKRISEIDKLTENNLNFIGEQSNLAKNKAIQIDAKNKTELYTLIRLYFNNYNYYIKETVFDIQKNGKKPNSVCAKLDFEKNHTKNK